MDKERKNLKRLVSVAPFKTSPESWLVPWTERVLFTPKKRLYLPLRGSAKMEEAAKKGRVTPLSSLFPVEEAQKAVRRVHETLTEKEAELDQVRGFVSDNNNLINLVQKLPESLHHNIMAKHPPLSLSLCLCITHFYLSLKLTFLSNFEISL